MQWDAPCKDIFSLKKIQNSRKDINDNKICNKNCSQTTVVFFFFFPLPGTNFGFLGFEDENGYVFIFFFHFCVFMFFPLWGYQMAFYYIILHCIFRFYFFRISFLFFPDDEVFRMHFYLFFGFLDDDGRVSGSGKNKMTPCTDTHIHIPNSMIRRKI